MHINLILGVVALGICWVLLKRVFSRGSAAGRSRTSDATENTALDAAAVLARELEARRGNKATASFVVERLEALTEEKIAAVGAALADMLTAMTEQERACFSWRYADGGIVLTLPAKGGGSSTELRISWNMPHVDSADLSGPAGSAPEGEYTVVFVDGASELCASFTVLVRRLAQILADAVA